MTGHEWLWVLVVVAILATGLPVIRTISARCGASPEVSRKSVHVLMGLVCVSFPWMFDRPLPVWVLAAAATIPLAVVRGIPALRSGVGSALHGIKRPSYGEVLFAPSVAAVFHFSGGDPYLHGIPIGILTLADAASAVGGTRWGRRHYGVGEGFKTVEGSLIFLTTAFLCVFLPLFLGGRLEMVHALWVALILATLAMMAEGISDRGFDNMVIPLGCVFALDRLLLLDTPSLTWRFVVLVVLLVLVLVGSRWSTLNGGALLGSVLLGYGCAILADWRFALPPSGVFISHLITTRKHHLIKSFDHRLDAVVSHALAAMPWVVAVALDRLPVALGLAGVSFAMMAQLAILDTATRNSVPGLSVRPLRAVLKGVFIAALPGLVWLWPYAGALVVPVASAFAATLVAVLWFDKLSRSWRGGDTALWMVKGLLALAVSLTAFLFQTMKPLEISISPGAGVPALRLSPQLPPPESLAGEEEMPDARIFALNDDGEVVAHAALWWTERLWNKFRIGTIGGFAAADERSAGALLDAACSHLRERECHMAVGPMNGNTWRKYRFVTWSDGRGAFLLEPRNPATYPEWWEAAGFGPYSSFSSSSVVLDGKTAVRPVLKERITRSGIMIRTLDLGRFDEELSTIHELSLRSFRQNDLYTDLDRESFLKSYRKVQPHVDPDLVLIAEREGKACGFVFAIPDLEAAARGERPAVIVKTLAVDPDARSAGLGSLLVDEIHFAARNKGYTEAIHALQHGKNTSLKITNRNEGRAFRSYTLFSKDL